MSTRFFFTEEYTDIIEHEHVSVPGHKPMTMAQRAAQFAPFAALSTHDAARKE